MGADVPAGHPLTEDRPEAGIAESTVRYHLHLAVQAEPSLREEYEATLGRQGCESQGYVLAF